jgi:pimeloyl-ACP methyl ester carboxylesterase
MRFPNKFFPAFFILLLIPAACEKSGFLTEGDYFFLKNNGAVMPVWVRGNLNSGTILITVHGGPGGTGHGFILSEGFKELEKSYTVVYWDQRFSGLSQGNPDKSTLTIEQFVDDVSKTVTLIEHKYPGKKLFLLGHSWGGGLAAAYLGQNNNQSKFSGWIDVDGSVRDDIEEQEIKKWILQRVPEHYNEDPEFWQFIVDWYDNHPFPLYSDEEPYLYISALNGDAIKDPGYPVAELVFSSPFSLAIYSNNVDQSLGNGIDFTNEIRNIKIPSLIMWGKEDGILPDTLSFYTYNQLGTGISDKSVIRIPGSAHSPFIDQPVIFAESVKQFIDKYTNP